MNKKNSEKKVSKKYYFMNYEIFFPDKYDAEKKIINSCVTNIHPFEEIATRIHSDSPNIFELLFWKEITKKEYDLYLSKVENGD